MDGKSLYPNVSENQDDIEIDSANIGTNLDSEAKVDLLVSIRNPIRLGCVFPRCLHAHTWFCINTVRQ